jgi:signal transduction histidine kinase
VTAGHHAVHGHEPSKRPGTLGAEGEKVPNALAVAHSRFARAALAIYLATALVAVGLLILALVTDKTHEENQTCEKILLETHVRAHSLSQHLGLLVDELRRLSLRSEVDLFDENLAPEKSLLQLSHERSTFFNLGVVILDQQGLVVWSEPEAFLARGVSFGGETWFHNVRRSRAFRIVPVQPDRPDSVLYVVSPLVKNQEFVGALLGAVDLARGDALLPKAAAKGLTVLATREGTVVYPPIPPAFSGEYSWRSIFGEKAGFEAMNLRIALGGERVLVASAPVAGTELVLLTVADQEETFRAARERLQTRISAGLGLALGPAFLLLYLLSRSLKVFRKSEEEAVRQERLRLLGEAAAAIAHEVKNALNGLSMGLDLVLRPTDAARRERILRELRGEIQRLAEFTTELMMFSRGVVPRPVVLDLSELTPKVLGLLQDAAADLGVVVTLVGNDRPIRVEADAALLHAVISNLTGNALDAVMASAGPPRVEIGLSVHGAAAQLRVRDSGQGVSESVKPRLFEPFQTGKPNGVGIGLALARNIARAHRGDLVLEDPTEPAADYPGASFVLTLPLLEER